jgi:PAS domain S-box-containing protein
MRALVIHLPIHNSTLKGVARETQERNDFSSSSRDAAATLTRMRRPAGSATPLGSTPARGEDRLGSNRAALDLEAATAATANLEVWSETHRHRAAIVEHSNDAIFSRTPDGAITTWNAAAERIFGFRAKEIVGRRSEVLLPPGRQDEFRKLLARIRRGEVVEHFETERLRKDGRHLYVSLTLSPIRDDAERLIGFSTIARDITEQRQVREALERRERELDDLFEEASVGLLLTGRDGRILRVNPAFLGILECKPDDCVGHAFSQFHPDRAALSALLRRLTGRETLRNVQTAVRSCRGRVKEVLLDANAFWENGQVVHIRWFIRDITRRKQLEREVLATSEGERCAFSRELHDSLGQQLSGIAYLSNVLRDRLRDQGSSHASDAAHISKLLKQAIEETRRVSRGLSPVRPDPEGLRTALSELAAHTRAVFGVACGLFYPKPVLVEDATVANHLYRIAQEAVNNAIRHGHARRITIGLAQRRGEVALSIVDNGKGIGALSPKRKGLGLRVMQYRAGLLQGTFSVRRRPAGGTEVHCAVPGPRLQAPKPPD